MESDAGKLLSKKGLLIFAAISFIVLLFVVVATPIEFLKIGPGKLTLWELQINGGGTIKVADLPVCDAIISRFKAAEAFSIISIFTALLTFLVALVGLAGVMDVKLIGAGLGGATFVFTIIVWTIIADLYNASHCGTTFKDGGGDYGAGFGLFVTAWCLTVVEVVAILVL